MTLLRTSRSSLASALFALLLVLTACGSASDITSEADVSGDAEADTETGIEQSASADTDEDSEDSSEEIDNDEENDVVSQAAGEEAAETVLEPVSASIEHETTSDDFPDIIAAQATPSDDGSWRFDVTVSSTYDTPQRYADAWRVVGPDGEEFGIRVLTHDHANEQPFTRSQSGIQIPSEVTTVTVQGRDLVNGWGGGVLELDLR